MKVGSPLLFARTHRGDVYIHYFAAPAATHAAHRRSIQIVASDRKPAVLRSLRLKMRDIDAEPPLRILQPGIHPGVTRRIGAIHAAEVTAHVARRYAAGAA